MSFKVGDTVQLKEPITGRRFKGKIKSITTDKKIMVTLPNGLYTIHPEEMWEQAEESEES